MAAPRKYPLELRERAVRTYRTAEADAGGLDDLLAFSEEEELATLSKEKMPSSSGERDPQGCLYCFAQERDTTRRRY